MDAAELDSIVARMDAEVAAVKDEFRQAMEHLPPEQAKELAISMVTLLYAQLRENAIDAANKITVAVNIADEAIDQRDAAQVTTLTKHLAPLTN